MLNILDLIFLNLAFMVIFTGVLINHFGKYIPHFIIKGYRYGGFAYDSPKANFLEIIEMPKSYFRHFYVFSSIFSSLMWCSMFLVYFLGINIHAHISVHLQGIMQSEEAKVSVLAAFLAMTLLTVQCIRRLYETQYLQIFAKTSKINLSHYLAGLIHYFGCIVAVIGDAPLFCGNQNKLHITWTDSYTKTIAVPCTLIFALAWYYQLQSNIIFADLRKDKKSGLLVITEDHRLPYGGLFRYVSSPHRLCEMVMYTVLLALIPTRTFFCIYLWVIGNQVQTAIQAHEWYKKTFKTYPKDRTAIIPVLL